MKYSLNLFSLAMITLCLGSCQSSHKDSGDSNLEHAEVKAEGSPYYALPDLDHGILQSPINIMSNQTQQKEHHVTLNFNTKIDKIENLGHTVQLDFQPGSKIAMDGIDYEFKQIHFHTPSEHLIDGVTYPMEMHVVNVLSDSESKTNTEYLVLSFLFKMGESNKFVDEFIDKIPNNAPDESFLLPGSVNFEDFLPEIPDHELHEWYHYLGSLTTPPYTESVNWYVFKHIYTASPAQIRHLNEIEGNNARHVQALNHRTVEVEQ